MKKITTILLALIFLIACKQNNTKNKVVKTKPTTKKIETKPTLQQKECGISENDYTKEKAIKERTVIIEILPEIFKTTSNGKVAYKTINSNTLEVTEKLTFNNKTVNNIYNLPLEKLADITINNGKITFYTKLKDINVHRFGYKEVKSGQFSIELNFSTENNQKLFKELKKLSKINCFLKTF